jgi:hypothetical protein
MLYELTQDQARTLQLLIERKDSEFWHNLDQALSQVMHDLIGFA